MATKPDSVGNDFVIVRVDITGQHDLCPDTYDNEAKAKQDAEAFAIDDKEDGTFVVYQKIGTARAARKVEWKGRAG